MHLKGGRIITKLAMVPPQTLVVFLCRFFLLSLRVFKHKACISKLALGLRTIKKSTIPEVQNLLEKYFVAIFICIRLG